MIVPIFLFFVFLPFLFLFFFHIPPSIPLFLEYKIPFSHFYYITRIMSAGQEGKSLSERVEVPSISKDAAKKIALLEQEFISADVEQRMFISILHCFG